MLRVICRFHDEEGNVTYLRAEEDFSAGMVDKFDSNGRTIIQMGDHAESIDVFTELAGDYLDEAQYDRFAAHLEAAGAGEAPQMTPQDENNEPTPQEEVEAEIESGQIEDESPKVAPNPVQ